MKKDEEFRMTYDEYIGKTDSGNMDAKTRLVNNNEIGRAHV